MPQSHTARSEAELESEHGCQALETAMKGLCESRSCVILTAVDQHGGCSLIAELMMSYLNDYRGQII